MSCHEVHYNNYYNNNNEAVLNRISSSFCPQWTKKQVNAYTKNDLMSASLNCKFKMSVKETVNSMLKIKI